VLLDDASFKVLYRLIEGEDPSDTSRRFFMLWLEDQQVLSSEFKENVRLAIKTTEEVLQEKRKRGERRALEKEGMSAMMSEEGSYWDRRLAVRKALADKALRDKAPDAERVGVRVEISADGEATTYELQPDLELREGHLSVVTPTKGAEMSVTEVAGALGLDPMELQRINAKVYEGLNRSSKLKRGTMLWLEDSDEEREEDEEQEEGVLAGRVVAPSRASRKRKEVESGSGFGGYETAREAARVLFEADPVAASEVSAATKRRLGLLAPAPERPSSAPPPPLPAFPPGFSPATQEQAKLQAGISSTQGRIDMGGGKGSSGVDLPPAAYLLAHNQSLETRLAILERNRPLPDFDTPEALFSAVNRVVRYDPHLSFEEKHAIQMKNDERAQAMRAKISGSKLDHEETKTLMKLTTVDMIAADLGNDKHLKSFGENLYKIFKRKVKDEDGKKKKEAKASSSQEPTIKDVLTAVQGARGGGKAGFGGKGGGGGKGKERPWFWVPYEERTCFVCGKVGHLASQCSEGGKGKGAEGKRE
jgi:hypothetical protein